MLDVIYSEVENSMKIGLMLQKKFGSKELRIEIEQQNFDPHFRNHIST